MSRMTKQEKSWVFYDWANSAYSILITTAIFPLYFKAAAEWSRTCWIHLDCVFGLCEFLWNTACFHLRTHFRNPR